MILWRPGDGILLKCGGGKGSGAMEMDYHFNVPIAAFHNKYETQPRIVFSFGYGDGQQRTLTKSIQDGSLYEVMLWFYSGEIGSDGYRKKILVRLLEALHVNWDTHNTKLAVHQFIKDKVRAVCGSDFVSQEVVVVGDLNIMPPKQRQIVEWGPGEVINWVHNSRRSRLEIQCQLQRSAAADETYVGGISDAPTKLHWESCGSIEPGAGEVSFQWKNPDFLLKHVDFLLKNVDFAFKKQRFRVNDGDMFKAIEDGQVVESWTADISRGVVHDIFLGGVPEAQHRLSAKREKKVSRRERLKKKGKDKAPAPALAPAPAQTQTQTQTQAPAQAQAQAPTPAKAQAKAKAKSVLDLL